MANLSLRMLSVFLLAAFLLNISNYLFMRLYNQPYQARLNYLYPKTASGVEMSRIPIKDSYWFADTQYAPKERFATMNQRTVFNESEQSTYSAYYLMLGKYKTTIKDELEDCPELPPGLGPELENRAMIAKNIDNFESKLNDVKPGGIYKPTSCKSRQSVAVIIAYRGFKGYLTTLMNILHPFLIKQQLDYQIFVIVQSNTSQPYNRGKLLNVGFTEATRYRKSGWQCIILHEPHIVPMDSRNLYRCSWFPKQLATSVERPVKASYVPLLGGAIAMTSEQFLKVNGFSNAYWDNDADYYDLYHRINFTNYYVENSFPLVGRFKTLRKGLALWHKSEYLTTPPPLYLLDGLTSLSYTVDVFELKRLYTYVQVNIDGITGKESKIKLYNKLLNPVTTNKTAEQLK
ncbi:beta-1,4-galactosyltransferase 4-like [Trichoplusia ni]|uniref:Beta-1,4-N-acetylgalactosaminyltransferase n=1 Tax=Trichoplusia ni TaxID=7111 RepID=A0A7E5VDE9_TRINI|nr:beta-1,4-galactosyltransferase 4-like [Trichoplusia ni]